MLTNENDIVDDQNNDAVSETKEMSSLLFEKDLTTKEIMIDPKNPTNVGTSFWNLGNHTLAICFIMCIVFVVYASYQ